MNNEGCVAQRQSLLEVSLETLETRANNLSEFVSCLEERLRGVTRQQLPCDDSENIKEEEEPLQIQRIKDSTTSISRSCYRIEDLLARLEV